MERELLERINYIETMTAREFLYHVLLQLELEFPNNNVRIIESLANLLSIRFGEYSVLLTMDEIEMLKDVEDPFSLDRYLLAHFLKGGLDVDPEASNYLKHIFGIYDIKYYEQDNGEDY